jgi:hypothetical protein
MYAVSRNKPMRAEKLVDYMHAALSQQPFVTPIRRRTLSQFFLSAARSLLTSSASQGRAIISRRLKIFRSGNSQPPN